MSSRLTSSLNEVRNDTGRTAFCGPVVASAITGYSVSVVEGAIHDYRRDAEHARRIIEGTTAVEIAAALAIFGYGMKLERSFMNLERKERPTLWTWMQKPRRTFTHYLLGVHVGKQGHWICIKGGKICDTYTGGRWTFVTDGPHRGARIMDVYTVHRVAEVPGFKLSEEQAPPQGPSRKTADVQAERSHIVNQ